MRTGRPYPCVEIRRMCAAESVGTAVPWRCARHAAGDECQALKTSGLRDASGIATYCFGSNFIATPFMQ